MTRAPFLPSCIAWLLAVSAPAQSRPSDPESRPLAPDFTSSNDAADRFLAKSGLPGAALQIGTREAPVHTRYLGAYSEKTVVPIASASKWLSGALLMTLVDDGKVDLDAAVGKYLPEFSGDKERITVRMLMNHTSGLPANDDRVHDFRITMREAARRASELELVSDPGTRFAYGGVAMQVAGALCEVAGGASWNDLFQKRIATPCKLQHTRFGVLARAKNPMVAGGAVSSLDEYGRFLRMIVNEGELDGVRVLSAESVRELLTDRTGKADPRTSLLTRAVGARGYGVGCWVDEKHDQGQTTRASSPGAFGFLPWVDLERGAWAVWMIEDRSRRSGLQVAALNLRKAIQHDLATLPLLGADSRRAR